MQIPISILNQFKIFASKIRTNKILPICGHLKITSKTISKTNLHQSVVFEHGLDKRVDHQDFLIDENVLFNFIASSIADSVTFTIDKQLTISDGEHPHKQQLLPFENFPDIPEFLGEWQIMDDKVLEAIKSASQIIGESDIPDITCFVFIGNGLICSSDRSLGYSEPITSDMKMVLPKITCDALKNISGSLEYGSDERNDYFKTGNAVLSFSKSELGFFDMSMIAKIESAKSDFEINKHDIIRFNNFCIATDPDGLVDMQDAHLSMINNYEDQFNMPSLTPSQPFRYNPGIMNKLLRVLLADSLLFFPGENKYFITDTDRSFTALIMACK